METRQFGSVDAAVSVVGQGTWNLDRGDRAAAMGALRHGLDMGMTHIDTAEMYGEAEPLVADAIEGRRDEVFLVSKVLPSHASRRGVAEACERSLRRLKTDRLDCYLLHWPSATPLAETIGAFENLKHEGKIRAWGLSNFDVDLLDMALRIAGPGRIACNQVLYHIEERAIEHAVLPWCADNGVALVAYSPFGSGVFPKPHIPGGRLLADIAAARGATPRQVALAFLTRHPSVFVIPKASSVAHAADNAAAGDLALTEDKIAAIDRAFPLGKRPRSLPMI